MRAFEVQRSAGPHDDESHIKTQETMPVKYSDDLYRACNDVEAQPSS